MTDSADAGTGAVSADTAGPADTGDTGDTGDTVPRSARNLRSSETVAADGGERAGSRRGARRSAGRKPAGSVSGDVDGSESTVMTEVVAPGAGAVGSVPHLREHAEQTDAAAAPTVREVVVDDLLPAGAAAQAPPAERVVAAQPRVEHAPAAHIPLPTHAQIRAARRLQARKVGRLVRHIDLWSLLKVALLFYTCMLFVGVVAGVVVWWLLQRSGAVSSVESFFEEIFLLEDFTFEGRTMFRIGVIGGMVGVVLLSLLTVVAGLLFNYISDLTGGIRLSVVELETARPAPPASRSWRRR